MSDSSRTRQFVRRHSIRTDMDIPLRVSCCPVSGRLRDETRDDDGVLPTTDPGEPAGSNLGHRKRFAPIPCDSSPPPALDVVIIEILADGSARIIRPL